MTLDIEEQILRFNIPVSDTLTMEIRESTEYLFEAAFGLTGTHASVERKLAQVHERELG
jgi:hypothetical protein